MILCPYCSRRLRVVDETVDHLIPKLILRGKLVRRVCSEAVYVANTRVVCRACNENKSCLLPGMKTWDAHPWRRHITAGVVREAGVLFAAFPLLADTCGELKVLGRLSCNKCYLGDSR